MRQSIRDTGLAFLLSMAVLVVLYPGHFLFLNQRFLFNHDSGIHLENIYTIISHWYQGSVQLFDRFDHMSYAYTAMTSGMYTSVNCILAAVYILLNGLSDHSSQFLHQMYSVGFYALNTLIRTMGGYLFLRKFTDSRWAVIIALVYLNTFLSSHFMNYGMHTNTLYSYLPLLFYFILCFFETFALRNLLLAVLVMGVAIANSPFFALGYFYLAVHFFIISCLLVFGFRGKKGFLIQAWAGIKGWALWSNTRPVVIFGLTMTAILLPYVMLSSVFQNDFFIAGSGMNGTEGRLAHAGDIKGYFNFPGRSYAHPFYLMPYAFDFSRNQWGGTWLFLGAGAVLLCAMAILLSRQWKKHTIITLSVFIMALNVPAAMASLSSLAHWLNALTNPFQFLVRSFHMTALLWPFALCALVALGIESLFALIRRDGTKVYLERRDTVLGFLGGIIFLFISWGLGDISRYALAAAAAFGFFIFAASKRSGLLKGLAASVLVLFLVSDLYFLARYINQNIYPATRITPRVINYIQSDAPLVLDYQNPHLLSSRIFYSTIVPTPTPDLFTRQSGYGAYYQYVPLAERFLRKPDLYEPRHKAYRDLGNDPQMRTYLTKDGRIMFFAPYAVRADQISMTEILSKGLDRQVVMVEDPQAPMLSDPRTTVINPIDFPNIVEQKFRFELAGMRRIQRKGFSEFRQKLPGDFPTYAATTVFGADALRMSVKLDGRALRPVQGDLSLDWTFDVRNIKGDTLAVRLPEDVDVKGKTLELLLSSFADVSRVWKNTQDQWGFDYQAPRDGWLVMHYPYDPKWRLWIDGKPQPVYQVNKYFIGTPLTQGKHQVLLSYWPGSILRFLLPLSIFTVMAALVYAFYQGYRILEEQRLKDGH